MGHPKITKTIHKENMTVTHAAPVNESLSS